MFPDPNTTRVHNHNNNNRLKVIYLKQRLDLIDPFQ